MKVGGINGLILAMKYKITCAQCETEFPKDCMELVKNWIYDVQSGNLWIDIKCICGSQNFLVREKKEEVLWPHERTN